MTRIFFKITIATEQQQCPTEIIEMGFGVNVTLLNKAWYFALYFVYI